MPSVGWSVIKLQCIVPTVKFGGGGIMARPLSSSEGKSNATVFPHLKMNAAFLGVFKASHFPFNTKVYIEAFTSVGVAYFV